MKRRRAHILQGNKGNQRPQHVIFFDTETSPTIIAPGVEKHTLRMGWACYYRSAESGKIRKPQWWAFNRTSQFWTFVDQHCKDNRRLYLVAHNVGFDLRIVEGFAYLKHYGWEQQFIYDKGLTTIARYTRSRQSLEIISTTNYFAMTLKALGDLVGLPKLEVDFDAVDDQTLSTYCKRDVEIILKAWLLWTQFLDRHDLGTFKRTISAQAFAAYRHRFMDTPIVIHDDMEVCRFEREAYRGGRTEVFKVGEFPKQTYFYLDVNGMYAFAMQSHPYPYKLCGHRKDLTLNALKNKLRNFSVIARVTIKTELPAFVVKHNGRNVYPTGVFDAVLTTPELTYALSVGAIEKVHEMAWYNQAYIFESYVKYFNDLKITYELEGNTTFRGIAKLYINALYGKFGQTGDKPSKRNTPTLDIGVLNSITDRVTKLLGRRETHNVKIDVGIFNFQTRAWKRPEGFQTHADRKEQPEESYNSFPAIVAHVTAYARIYLWQLIVKAGRSNVFYCDTDSLIVNQQGLDNLKDLIHPTKLGYLKIEKQGNNLRIFAPKDYEVGNRMRRKGIRRNAEQLAEGVYRQNQFLGLAGAIRQGNTDLVTISKITKTLHRVIKTGTVGDDGWITPFCFPLCPSPSPTP